MAKLAIGITIVESKKIMGKINLYCPSSQKLIKAVAEKRDWKWNGKMLQEDSMVQSNKSPIFAVADGVTLIVKPGNRYPCPSGAGRIAKIICSSLINNSEKEYHEFNLKGIQRSFYSANKEAGKYNQKRGRTKKTINYLDRDYFCATAALMVIKEKKLFYGVIGDSRVMVWDQSGQMKFKSVDQVAPIEKAVAAMVKNPQPQEKKVAQHKYFRNKVASNGALSGYGVINGEKEALQYVESGVIDTEKGDRVFIYTDGFEPYFELAEFNDLFRKWPTKKEILDFVKKFRKENMPSNAKPDDLYKFLYKYTAEGSMTIISVV